MKIDPNTKKEKLNKFKNLFESTADEIFYDFIGEHKKKIISIIILVLLFITLGTCYWVSNEKNNQTISFEIQSIIQKKKNHINCKEDIRNSYNKIKSSPILESLNLNLTKVAYKATLLLLEDVENMSSEEWREYLHKVKCLSYVCQYVHTTQHFKRFSFAAEFLFLKTLYYMEKKGYSEDEMRGFFMEKKLHASILNSYMSYLLGFSKCHKDMLNDILQHYDYTITNFPKGLLFFAKSGVAGE
jgi:hypothetical protein